MSNEIISKSLVGIWVFLLITPPILALLSIIAQYVWFRGKKEFHLAYGFQGLLFSRLHDLFFGKGDWEEECDKVGLLMLSYFAYTFL